MRIVVIVHGVPPVAQGGTELYAHTHALALHRRYGDEVLILTREHDRNRPEYDIRTEQRDGLRIISINNTFRGTRSFAETYQNEAITGIASRAIDDFKPDTAHIHHLTCLSTTIVRALAERGIPRIVTLHDYWLLCHRGQLLDRNYRVCEGPHPSRCHACVGAVGGSSAVAFVGAIAVREIERRLPGEAARRRLRKLTERLADLTAADQTAQQHANARLEHMREVCGQVTQFLAPSRYIRDRFVQFGVDPGRIAIAPYGTDAAIARTAARTRADHLRLGFIGSLMISKAPHLLIEAAARLPRHRATVDLFGAWTEYHGDDGYRQTLEPLLKADGVTFHGLTPHDRIGEALAAIDVLVVPSIWPENSPFVVQEALRAGVPVVASRIGGIPEILEDGQNGLLFRPGDVEDLARTLSRFIDEPSLLAALRDGIRPVRTIEDDVALARRLHTSMPAVPSRARIAAVVLNHQTADDTLLAVRSLLASRRPLDEVIVVDNDGVGSARDALRPVWSNIRYLHTAANLGFSGGVNVGIRDALSRGADRVLLVNSDMIVPPDCIERLEACVDAHPRTGIAGPLVLSRSDPRRIASLGLSYRPFVGRAREHGVGAPAAPLNRAGSWAVDAVSGCLMLVERKVFDAVGLFDEDYFFSFEDLDFCLRARRAGFTTRLAVLATAYHEGARSIGSASSRRLYFAARGHLLAARRADPTASRAARLRRSTAIVLLNLAHAVRVEGGSMPARLGAVARGTRDYFTGRFGADT